MPLKGFFFWDAECSEWKGKFMFDREDYYPDPMKRVPGREEEVVWKSQDSARMNATIDTSNAWWWIVWPSPTWWIKEINRIRQVEMRTSVREQEEERAKSTISCLAVTVPYYPVNKLILKYLRMLIPVPKLSLRRAASRGSLPTKLWVTTTVSISTGTPTKVRNPYLQTV